MPFRVNSGVRAILFMYILMLPALVQAQKKFNVYYLCFGSSHYKNNPALDSSYLVSDVEEAAVSAGIMAELMQKYGSGKGILWNSAADTLFSKKIFQVQLEKVWDMMKKDGADNPLLVIYYCGHGFAENLTYNQFLLSGDCSKQKREEQFEERCKKNVFVPEIVQMIATLFLQKPLSKVLIPRYMLLMDCCRSKLQNDKLNKQRGKANWGKDWTTVETVFNKTAEFALEFQKITNQGADPILYTTKNLEKVYTVNIPATSLLLNTLQTDSDIGPLCRRALKYLDKQNGAVTLETFVAGLINSRLDKNITEVPVTPYPFGKPGNYSFLFIHK